MAQLVAHPLDVREVTSSSLVSSTIKSEPKGSDFFFFWQNRPLLLQKVEADFPKVKVLLIFSLTRLTRSGTNQHETELIKASIEQAVEQQKYINVLEDLFYGCTRYRIKQASSAAIKFCRRVDIEDYEKRYAVEYLDAVFGAGYVVKQLVPIADDKLLKIILHIQCKCCRRMK